MTDTGSVCMKQLKQMTKNYSINTFGHLNAVKFNRGIIQCHYTERKAVIIMLVLRWDMITRHLQPHTSSRTVMRWDIIPPSHIVHSGKDKSPNFWVLLCEGPLDATGYLHWI